MTASNLGFGSGSYGSGYGLAANPYQGDQAAALQQQTQQALGMGLNQINSSAVGAGGLGGGRQGVAQGVAIGQATTGLDSALANLYGTDWQNQQQNNLTQQGLNNQYTLGLGSLANTAQANQNSYNLGLGSLDLNSTALGAQLYNQGVNGQWNPISNASSSYSPYTGFGTTTGQTSQGGGAMGALGGALGTWQLVNALGKTS